MTQQYVCKWAWLVMLMAWCFPANTTSGQAADLLALPEPPEMVEPIVVSVPWWQALNDDRYDVRQKAMLELMWQDDVSDQQIRERLQATDSIEETHRLYAVLRNRLIYSFYRDNQFPSENGSLGLLPEAVPANYVSNQSNVGIRVGLTIPGFPAHGHLMLGDVILKVDGQPIPEESPKDWFTNHLKELGPGQPVQFDVLRHGQDIQVETFTISGQALRNLLRPKLPRSLNTQYLSPLNTMRNQVRDLSPDSRHIDLWVLLLRKIATRPPSMPMIQSWLNDVLNCQGHEVSVTGFRRSSWVSKQRQ